MNPNNPTNPLAEDLDHILTHTRDLWEELRDQRIFITGGTGFFGCWFLESFAWANDKLHLNTEALVLTRHYEAFLKKAPHLATHPAIKFHIGALAKGRKAKESGDSYQLREPSAPYQADSLARPRFKVIYPMTY